MVTGWFPVVRFYGSQLRLAPMLIFPSVYPLFPVSMRGVGFNFHCFASCRRSPRRFDRTIEELEKAANSQRLTPHSHSHALQSFLHRPLLHSSCRLPQTLPRPSSPPARRSLCLAAAWAGPSSAIAPPLRRSGFPPAGWTRVRPPRLLLPFYRLPRPLTPSSRLGPASYSPPSLSLATIAPPCLLLLLPLSVGG
jgi:hypothetical protein